MNKENLQWGIRDHVDPCVNDIELGDCVGRGGFGEIYDIGQDDKEVLKIQDPSVLARECDARSRQYYEKLYFEIMDREAKINEMLYKKVQSDYLLIANKCFVIEDHVSQERTDRVVCLRMPKIEMDLNEYAECTKVDEELLLKVASDAAKGMRDYNKVGVVHRDISPANLFFRSLDMDGKPHFVIGDFGISKPAKNGKNGVTSMTRLLNPDFASPEQLNEKNIEKVVLDIRSDIYSLGKSLTYFTISESEENLTQKDAPSKTNFSKEFLELLNKMTKEEREDRPQTPEELLKSVEKLQEMLRVRKEQAKEKYEQEYRQKKKEMEAQYQKKVKEVEKKEKLHYKNNYKKELKGKEREINKLKRLKSLKNDRSVPEGQDSTSRFWLLMMAYKLIAIVVGGHFLLQAIAKSADSRVFAPIISWLCTAEGQLATNVFQIEWVRYGLIGLILVDVVLAILIPYFYKKKLSRVITGVHSVLLAVVIDCWMLSFTQLVYEQSMKEYIWSIIGFMFCIAGFCMLIVFLDFIGVGLIAGCFKFDAEDQLLEHYKVDVFVYFGVFIAINSALPFIVYTGTSEMVIRFVVALVLWVIPIGALIHSC